MQEILPRISEKVRVNLTEAFDRNFERKGFFNQPWPQTKRPVRRGSLMIRTSALRNSIQSRVEGESILFSSDRPYAEIHNSGGIMNRVSKKGKPCTIHMPQRQFVGAEHEEVNRIVEGVLDEMLPEEINRLLRDLANTQ